MLEFRYDTQLLIDGHDLDEDVINDYFTDNFKGDCLLAVGDDELIKIHFHTNEPWKVLEYCASRRDLRHSRRGYGQTGARPQGLIKSDMNPCAFRRAGFSYFPTCPHKFKRLLFGRRIYGFGKRTHDAQGIPRSVGARYEDARKTREEQRRRSPTDIAPVGHLRRDALLAVRYS